jgi:hypothetical protein
LRRLSCIPDDRRIPNNILAMKLNLLRLSTADGQAYEFRRE